VKRKGDIFIFQETDCTFSAENTSVPFSRQIQQTLLPVVAMKKAIKGQKESA